MASIGHDARARIHMRGVQPGLAERFRDQSARKTFSEAEQLILRSEIKLPRNIQIVQKRLKRAKISAQFVIERVIGRPGHKRIRQLLVPHVDIPHGSESRPEVTFRSSVSRIQQLIGDFGQCAHYYDGLRSPPALHDANQPLDGGRVLYRRASKLHHQQIVALLESALSLAHRVVLRSEVLGAKKNPPPDRFWRWVRVAL